VTGTAAGPTPRTALRPGRRHTRAQAPPRLPEGPVSPGTSTTLEEERSLEMTQPTSSQPARPATSPSASPGREVRIPVPPHVPAGRYTVPPARLEWSDGGLLYALTAHVCNHCGALVVYRPEHDGWHDGGRTDCDSCPHGRRQHSSDGCTNREPDGTDPCPCASTYMDLTARTHTCGDAPLCYGLDVPHRAGSHPDQCSGCANYVNICSRL
jgi:hypothetical protein